MDLGSDLFFASPPFLAKRSMTHLQAAVDLHSDWHDSNEDSDRSPSLKGWFLYTPFR